TTPFRSPKLLAVTRSSSLSWTCSGDLESDHQPGDHPGCARRSTHRLDRREAIRGASITAVFRALLPGRSISTRVDGSRPGWRSGLRTAVVGVAEILAVAFQIGATTKHCARTTRTHRGYRQNIHSRYQIQVTYRCVFFRRDCHALRHGYAGNQRLSSA